MTNKIRINKQALRRSAIAKDNRAALYRCLSLMDAFRSIRRTMPLQHVYAFLVVASEQGHGVSEYAKCAGTTQAVMTRILFALGAGGHGRRPGYGLLRQVTDPQDGRRTQTFLTAKGEQLVNEIARSTRPHGRRAMERRNLAMKVAMAETSQRDLARDQWLFRLIEQSRELAWDDVQLMVRQAVALLDHRQFKTIPRRRRNRASTSP